MGINGDHHSISYHITMSVDLMGPIIADICDMLSICTLEVHNQGLTVAI